MTFLFVVLPAGFFWKTRRPTFKLFPIPPRVPSFKLRLSSSSQCGYHLLLYCSYISFWRSDVSGACHESRGNANFSTGGIEFFLTICTSSHVPPTLGHQSRASPDGVLQYQNRPGRSTFGTATICRHRHELIAR